MNAASPCTRASESEFCGASVINFPRRTSSIRRSGLLANETQTAIAAADPSLGRKRGLQVSASFMARLSYQLGRRCPTPCIDPYLDAFSPSHPCFTRSGYGSQLFQTQCESVNPTFKLTKTVACGVQQIRTSGPP